MNMIYPHRCWPKVTKGPSGGDRRYRRREITMQLELSVRPLPVASMPASAWGAGGSPPESDPPYQWETPIRFAMAEADACASAG
jgi:hypothetical protein